jgi:hypothetical protein
MERNVNSKSQIGNVKTKDRSEKSNHRQDVIFQFQGGHIDKSRH